jgi:hypothetical protein
MKRRLKEGPAIIANLQAASEAAVMARPGAINIQGLKFKVQSLMFKVYGSTGV